MFPCFLAGRASRLCRVARRARMSWPRMREDQLQRLAWTSLVPLALLQVALTAVGVVVTA